MKLLFLSGSFHTKSRSIALLKEIKSLYPKFEVSIPKLDKVPFYSDDLDKKRPQMVSELFSLAENSDGIIICTPEYNHSIPAVLKNAIDWVSRPAFNSVLKDKPVTIITQAQSPVGGARAQAHLKLVLDSTLSDIHMTHEMTIPGIDNVLNEQGKIVDEKTMMRLKRHIDDFIEHIEKGIKKAPVNH